MFNVGNRRRLKHSKEIGFVRPASAASVSSSTSQIIPAEPGTSHSAAFFDPLNAESVELRHQAAMETLDDLLLWLQNGGKVAIHDATNSTVQRRQELLRKVSQHKNVECFFIESICTDQELLEKNIKLKLAGPDYLRMDPVAAMADFKERIKNYEKSYKTISEEEEAAGLSYIKLINVGQKMISNRIHGYLPSQAAFYLMQLNINDSILLKLIF